MVMLCVERTWERQDMYNHEYIRWWGGGKNRTKCRLSTLSHNLATGERRTNSILHSRHIIGTVGIDCWFHILAEACELASGGVCKQDRRSRAVNGKQIVKAKIGMTQGTVMSRCHGSVVTM